MLCTAELLLEFFRFYAAFPFVDNVVDLLTAEVIPMDKFELADDIVRRRYVNLQDPFDRVHNIGKPLTIDAFLCLRATLRRSVVDEIVRRECRAFSQRFLDLRALLLQPPDVSDSRRW